jgi:hypothetical protein
MRVQGRAVPGVERSVAAPTQDHQNRARTAKAAADSTAKLPPHGTWSGDDAGRTPRYPASFSTSEGGADACTEVSHASSL